MGPYNGLTWKHELLENENWNEKSNKGIRKINHHTSFKRDFLKKFRNNTGTNDE